MKKYKIAILGSGNGSNFEAITTKIQKNKIPQAEIEFVFSNNKNAYILQRAIKLNIPAYTFSVKGCNNNRKVYNQKLLELLQEKQIDYIIAAGYMLVLPSEIVDQYKNKIINIHPSLLPEFKGLNAIKRAYDSDSKYGGVTVHFVNKKIDSGNIVLQEKIVINRKKSLEVFENKIHQIEHKIFWKAIKKVLENGEENK